MSTAATTTTSAWKVPSTRLQQSDQPISVELQTSVDPPASSLADIMSEQLALELETQEVKSIARHQLEDASTSEQNLTVTQLSGATEQQDGDDKGCSDDFLLAQLLQREFDKEYDEQLRQQEQTYNGNDKVRLTFGNYYRSSEHTVELSDTDSSDDAEAQQIRQKATDKKYSPEQLSFGPSGMRKRPDGTIVTKHDQVVCGKKNVSKVLEFPPSFPTGDVAAAVDMNLSNRIYNDLRNHSKAEQKRQHKIRDPKSDKATAELSLDAATRLLLFKMIESGLLESVSGGVATGKESIVFHAYGGCIEGGARVPNECAIKVYKTTLNEFKNRVEYVKEDYRFKNPRKVMRVWAEKEMLNLNRMRRAGINCPEVVKLKKHLLVMSFIGSEGKPAPKLKEVTDFSEAQLERAYTDCAQTMTRMYQHCHLVHADLSEFNVLWWEERCWFIDVAQAVDTSHPRGLIFLARDCRNVRDFFTRRGLDTNTSTRELFNCVTGLDLEKTNEEDCDDDFMAEVERYCADNRSTQRQQDKDNPADASLRKFYEDQQENTQGTNPSALYE